MTKVSISIGEFVVTRSISSEDRQRVLNAHRTLLGPVTDIIDGITTPRERTDAEVVKAWADSVFDRMILTVQRQEALAIDPVVLT